MSDNNVQIDLKDYWAILIRRKIILIMPAIIIPLIAFAVSYFLPRIYASSVTILLNESSILPPTVERELEGRQGNRRVDIRDRQESFTNQITSTPFLRRLIAVLDLPVPERIRQISAETKSSYPEISENELSEIIMADDLRNKVLVQFRSLNLFRMSFAASNPVEAQRRAKALADIFIEESLAQELAGVRSNIAFSEEQLTLYRNKLKAAEDRLRDFRKQLLVSEAEEDTSGFDLRQIGSAIEALDIKINFLETQRNDLRGTLITGDIIISTLTLPNNIENDKNKLITNIATLTDLLTRYDWRDPRILNLNEEARLLLGATNAKITDHVNERFEGLSVGMRETIAGYLITLLEIDFNREKKTTLDKSIIEIKKRLSRNPDTEITMQRLQSEIDNYRTIYELFVSRAQYAAIHQSAKKVEAEAKYLITKPASLPLGPESPNRKKLVLMGLILGLVLGVGAILLIEMLDNSFKKVEEVEQFLGVNVIGTIPHIDLPFGSSMKKRIPAMVGAGISFLLILLILFLNFKLGGR
ncbi:MAG: Wzz/FepE/Etk N-terminal domain-containing protein [candidate division Zixibacteria bacterium]